MNARLRHAQAGSVIVEFALAFSLFWVGLIAVVEFSRLMFTWGTAAEATRRAARLASTCAVGTAQADQIRAKVRPLVIASGQVDLGTRTDWLAISYLPSGCTADTCTMVDARLSNVAVSMMVPGLSRSITIPAFPVRLPREAMRNSTTDGSNAKCT